ncbi:Predicted ATP-binding protein involved in virulence [Mycobacteroides abscessus subsp. bolletii]|nr:Predicted ATP-binding protein involved in virulence [Mycobacteroides abscessus subsp. bolletii]
MHAQVTGVLGSYEHNIPFDADNDYIIIYGPNGVGKTKTLEVIDALSRLDGRKLCRLPFVSAELTFTESYRITATLQQEANEDSPLTFKLYRGRRKVCEWEYANQDSAEWLAENTPWEQFDDDYWHHIHTNEIMSQADLEARYAGRIVRQPAPPILVEFSERTPSRLIETQRLRAVSFVNPRFRPPPRMRRKRAVNSRISAQAIEMLGLIDQAQRAHSRLTQERDRTFPSRVLRSTSTDEQVSDEVIRERYDQQNEFRARLARVVPVPLADDLSLPEEKLDSSAIKLLDLYLSDAEEKLEPFQSLLSRIELLENILNQRLLRKRVEVNATNGLEVVEIETGREIPLESLSSGEQHEIILVFDLLFNVPEGALVLIDEPEISLHVGWQMKFIPDVRRIGELRHLRFIVATHSPQIINGDWDRALRLGPAEAEF